MRGFMVCYHQMHDFLPWFGPNATALERILDAMSEARLNALLIEYETYFPWSADNARICASDHLTEADVIQLNASAAARGIENRAKRGPFTFLNSAQGLRYSHSGTSDSLP